MILKTIGESMKRKMSLDFDMVLRKRKIDTYVSIYVNVVRLGLGSDNWMPLCMPYTEKLRMMYNDIDEA